MATPQKPQGCTYYKLRQLMRILTPYYDAHMAAAGIKITQYSLLSHIERNSPITQADLAKKMAMDASTLSRNLRPLHTAGWITQTAEDARSHHIALSEAGQLKLSECQRHWRTAQRSVNALVGEDDITALHTLIERVSSQLRTSTLEV